MLKRIVFCTDRRFAGETAEEIRDALREMESAGLEGRALSFSMENRKEAEEVLCAAEGTGEKEIFGEETLFLADTKELYAFLKEKGLYVTGYLHSGNEKEKFPGAPCLVMEPQYTDRDSWEKIHERLAGIPWTILTTERCIVREMTEEDLDGLYRMYEDPDARRFLEPLSEDREEERKILRAYISKVYGFYGFGTWSVLEKETGRLIGRAGLSPQAEDPSAVSLGYLIDAPYRGKGLAKEVCLAIRDYALDMLGFGSVEAVCDRENAASRALLGSMGFTAAGEVLSEGRTMIRCIYSKPRK